MPRRQQLLLQVAVYANTAKEDGVVLEGMVEGIA